MSNPQSTQQRPNIGAELGGIWNAMNNGKQYVPFESTKQTASQQAQAAPAAGAQSRPAQTADDYIMARLLAGQNEPKKPWYKRVWKELKPVNDSFRSDSGYAQSPNP